MHDTSVFRPFRTGAKVLLAVVLALGTVIAAERPALATSITVNTATDPAPVMTQQGLRYPNDAFCSLRAAITSAQNNSNAHDTDCATGLGNGVMDIIVISPDLRGQTLTLSYTAGTPPKVQAFDRIYSLNNPMEIIGPTTNAADFTINANNAVRPFILGWGAGLVDGASLKLANLTISNGNGTDPDAALKGLVQGDGGAMWIGSGSQVTLDNVFFRNNNASSGGGTVTARGGAIYMSSSTLTSNGGAFVGNRAAATHSQQGHGGAVYLISEDAPAVMNGYAVLLEGNSASNAGGAVAAVPGTGNSSFLLQRSLLINNTATVGGGLWATGGIIGGATFTMKLQDSTATGNSATQGGGVFFSTGLQTPFEFLRNTFVGNPGTGGVFSAQRGFIANSIIKDSTCQSTGTFNLSGSTNLVAGTTTGCSIVSPIGTVTNLSGTLAQNGGPEVQRTYALQSGSNAIDSGNQTYCGDIDARSVPRGVNGFGAVNSPAAGDCDIGSYEYADVIINWLTGTSQVDEGDVAHIAFKVSIPNRVPLPAPVTVPVLRDQSSTARASVDYSVPATSITIPQGTLHGQILNYSVTTLQDNIAERNGEQLYLDLGDTAGVVTAEPRRHFMVIRDDDQAGVLVNDGGNGTTVTEVNTAAADSFSISLRSQPDYSQPDPNDSNSYGPLADVDVLIRPDRDCTATVGNQTATLANPATITILNANWQSGTSISVRAVQDLYDEDFRDETATHECTITYTFDSLDPVYDATTDRYNVRVGDNDVAGVTLAESGNSTSTAEGTFTDTYTVRLQTPPDPGDPLPSPLRTATTVVVTPDAQCSAGSGAGVPHTLSFTEANWDQPQTVTVTPAQDQTVELDHQCSITHSVGSATGDPVYDDIDANPPIVNKAPGPITVAIQDYDPPNNITDDPPHVVITAGSVAVNEGAPATADIFQVVLLRQPLADVFVNLSTPADPRVPGPGLQVLLDDTTTQAAPAGTLQLKFTNGNWSTPQTVTVLPNDDDFDEDPTHAAQVAVAIDSSARGFSNPALRAVVVDGVTTLDSGTVAVTVGDDDTSGVTLAQSNNSTSVVEGGAPDQYTFVLDTHPYADVTVTVDPPAGCDVGEGDGAPLSIPVAHANWNALQTVTVSATDDNLVGASLRTCTLTHSVASADGLYAGLPVSDVVVNVTDNDDPVILVSTGAGGLDVDEASSANGDSATVVLQNRPDAAVTVDLAISDGQLVFSPSVGTTGAVTFSTTDWNQSQTVTVLPVDDDYDEDTPHTGIVNLGVTSGATRFNAAILKVDGATTNTMGVDITDDDVAAIVTDGADTLAVSQTGLTDTFTVRADTTPRADITFNLSTDGDCQVSPTSITLTPAQAKTAQQVTVSSADDHAVNGLVTCDITIDVASSDLKYDVLSTPVQASVDDVGLAKVLLTVGTLELDEATPATTDGVGVVLDAQPQSDVTVTFTTTDGQSGFDGAGTATRTLTFSSANWATPQTADLYVVDDFQDEGGVHAGSVAVTIASAAVGYADPAIRTDLVDGVEPAGAITLPVSINDNDIVGVVVIESNGTTAVTEGGAGDDYTVALGTPPVGDVDVTVDPASGCDVGAGDGSAVTLTFNAANWNGPQTVSVGATDDDAVGASPRPCAIAHSVASTADAGYDGLTVGDVSVSITDDDLAIAAISTAGGLAIAETGPTSDTFTVVLENQPDANVTVELTADAQGLLSVGGAPAGTLSLTFTAGDWNQPQTVTVSGVDDDVAEDDPHPAAITAVVTSDATGFGTPIVTVDGVTTSTVTADVSDNDAAGLVMVGHDTLAVNQTGLTDTFTVRTATTPAAPISIVITTDGDCQVSPSTIPLGVSEAKTAQTVTVSSADDDAVNGPVTCDMTVSVNSGDQKYDVISTPIQAAVDDVGLAKVLVTAGTLTLDEDDAATLEDIVVVLDAQPQSDVTVTLTTSDGQTGFDANGATIATLTFTSADWATPQTADLYVVDDLAVEGGTHAASVALSVASQAPGYSDPAVRSFVVDGTNVGDGATLPVSVEDNDTPEVDISESLATTSVTEGGAGDDYTVELATLPLADVTVTVDPMDGCNVGAGDGLPIELVFTAGTWNIPQTVTVNAVDDALVGASPRTCQVSHGAASIDANYVGLLVASVLAQVTDNDDPLVTITTAGGLVVSEPGGAFDTFDVVLDKQPDADVLVQLSADAQVLVDTGSGPAAAQTLMFTNGNWNQAQTVTVTGVDDDIDEIDPHAGTITVAVDSTATRYDNAPVAVDAAATNTMGVDVNDDDVANILVTNGSLLVDQSGTTDDYLLSAQTTPSSDISIQITAGPECTVTPASLTLTPADARTGKTVTVSAPDDDSVDGPTTCTISHAATSLDGNYHAIGIANAIATIDDAGLATVEVTAGALQLDEADDTATVDTTVVLGAKPLADVAVTLTSQNGDTAFDAAGLSTTTLTFTPTDWGTPQTVTVWVVDDAVFEGPHSDTLSLTVASTAYGYTSPAILIDGVPTSNVAIAVLDDESAPGGPNGPPPTPGGPGGPGGPPTPPPDPPLDPAGEVDPGGTLDVPGDDAVAAALGMSKATFPDGAANVAILARDDVFADSMASAAGQGKGVAGQGTAFAQSAAQGSPLLVTDGQQLDDDVAAELERLGVSAVVLLGGVDATSADLEAQLVELGYEVRRVQGASRVETAIALAEVFVPDATTALLARAYPAGEDQSQAYADALTVGPVAAENGWPVLLTATESLHPAVRDYLASSGIQEVVVVGGEAAVSAAVVSELEAMGLTVRRISGPNRFATAIAIAAERGFDDAGDANRVIITEGGPVEGAWVPGFASALHAVLFDAPILLSSQADLPPETETFLSAEDVDSDTIVLVCNALVHEDACAAASSLLHGPGS